MSTATLATNPYALTDNAFLMGENTDQPYVLRVRDLPSDEKPREKLLQLGADNLSLPELVAVLWGVGTKKEDVLLMAQRMVKEYGQRALGTETNPQKLADSLDIPLVKACQLVACFEIGRRFHSSSGGRPVYVRNAKQAHQYLRTIAFSSKEQLRGLYVNSRYQVVHDEVISVGTLTSNLVHAREVFQPAIEHGAIAVIIGHNHPSGVIEPTEADFIVTRQLIKAGKILGIDLIDHLIVTENNFVSILDYLDEQR